MNSAMRRITIKGATTVASAMLLALCLAVTAQAVSISVTPKKISDDSVQPGITFAAALGTDTFKLANEYVELFYQPYDGISPLPQYPQWRVDLFTNNPPCLDGLIRAGLINANANSNIAAAWVSSTSASMQISTSSAIEGGWKYLKDVGESDWSTAYTKLYTMVQDQGPGFSASSQTTNIYFEANFANASAGSFDTNVWFEIYQEADFEPPTITHEAISKIVGTGNVLRFRATVEDNQNVQSAQVHYKIDSGAWVNVNMSAVSGGTSYSKNFVYTLSQADLLNASKIYYYITATDGVNTSDWNGKTISNPQEITFTNDIPFLATLDGQLVVPDGNPDDGNTGLDIPVGALSAPVDITITQLDVNSVPQRAFGDINKDRPFMAFEFSPEGLHFAKQVKLTILYLDVDNDDKVEFPDGTETDMKPEDLKVCWYDGFEWRLVGGVLDKQNHTLSVYIDHFSKYALFAQGAMTAADYRPKEKIITPATVDGINDYAGFDGLSGVDFSIKIYDINGRNIRTINSPDMPRWDGKDEGGSVVESGAYIYQFKADVDGKKKLISGTVIIAK